MSDSDGVMGGALAQEPKRKSIGVVYLIWAAVVAVAAIPYWFMMADIEPLGASFNYYYYVIVMFFVLAALVFGIGIFAGTRRFKFRQFVLFPLFAGFLCALFYALMFNSWMWVVGALLDGMGDLLTDLAFTLIWLVVAVFLPWVISGLLAAGGMFIGHLITRKNKPPLKQS